jgi:uncharacterized membrane protein YcaP (DUF421 family)
MELWESVEFALGLGEEHLNAWHMGLRALLVFVFSIALVRVGEKRFLGKNTAFDVILGFILGSVLSRAVTGQSPFFPTLFAGFVLVFLHWLLAAVSFRLEWFGPLVKGNARVLVRDGEIQWREMAGAHVSKNDLMSALRQQARVDSLEDVEEARLERSGEISVLKREREREPQVVEIGVADGVKTVRVILG